VSKRIEETPDKGRRKKLERVGVRKSRWAEIIRFLSMTQTT
jgi:hypothetical protein